MARTGWSTSDFLRYAGGVLTATPLTIAAWAKMPNTPGGAAVITGLFTSGSASNRNRFSLQLSNGLLVAATGDASTSVGATTSSSYSLTDWFHGCAVFASATSRAAYLNGGGKGTNATSITPSGINRTSVGVGDGSSADQALTGGTIAEVTYWSAALTDAEVAALANGIWPFMVRPDAIVAHFPLVGRYSPEINLKSNAAVLSIQGTLAQAPHPRIVMPRRMLSA